MIVTFGQVASSRMQSDAAKKAAANNSWNVDVVHADGIMAFLDKEWDAQRTALIDLGLVTP